ncbi:hypothetical protein Trydic_g19968 [Trypoxylus dichotomus]
MSGVVLESRPFRPFKSSEEYLYAMKEDLAEWFQMLYPHLRINVENFMDRLETGVALCEVSPVEKIVCGIENAVSILEPNIAETVRQEVCTILRSIRSPTKNLNTEEFKAVTELKRDENIIILLADRGNATVVLNTRDYKDKMQKLLDDPTYKPITTDPTTYLEKITRTKINKKKSIISREKVSKNVRVAEDT